MPSDAKDSVPTADKAVGTARQTAILLDAV
jgi:hypothetical protein